MPRLTLPLLLATGFYAAPGAADFSHRSDLSVRLDGGSDRSLRGQYRLRLRPALSFGDAWSLHGFVATGREFKSAYDTIDDDVVVHVRRLFARLERDGGKLEVGVVPPYKGRVSSTGLSKEGWLRGARIVRALPSGALEFVVGDLSDLRAKTALSSPFDVDYYEVEYSGRLGGTWSFEIGGESMFGDRFVRGELRYRSRREVDWAAELVRNLSVDSSKVVFSASKRFSGPASGVEWFSYYTYTGSEFGLRAELS